MPRLGLDGIRPKRGDEAAMDVQVEVQFTVQHTLAQLKAEFVQRGHIPAWRTPEEAGRRTCFSRPRS